MTVTAAPVSHFRQTDSDAPSVRAVLGGALLGLVVLVLALGSLHAAGVAIL